MAQCPSCGAGLTKKEIHKTVQGSNPQPVRLSSVSYTSSDDDYYDGHSPKEVIEVTYECMFCGNVYEEWELRKKKETLEMNGMESEMLDFLLEDK